MAEDSQGGGPAATRKTIDCNSPGGIEAALDAAPQTQVVGLLRAWRIVCADIETLARKREAALSDYKDRVIAGLMGEEIAIKRDQAGDLMRRIAAAPSTALVDTVCKLAAWRLSLCPLGRDAAPETQCAAAAFDELLEPVLAELTPG